MSFLVIDIKQRDKPRRFYNMTRGRIPIWKLGRESSMVRGISYADMIKHIRTGGFDSLIRAGMGVRFDKEHSGKGVLTVRVFSENMKHFDSWSMNCDVSIPENELNARHKFIELVEDAKTY